MDSFKFTLYQCIENNSIGYLDMTFGVSGGDPVNYHVTEGLSFIPLTGYIEIWEIEGVAVEDSCNYLNSSELYRAREDLNKIKKILTEIPSCHIHLAEKEYYENIIGSYLQWFKINQTQPMNLDLDKNKSKNLKLLTRPIDPTLPGKKSSSAIEYFNMKKRGVSQADALAVLGKKYNRSPQTIHKWIKTAPLKKRG